MKLGTRPINTPASRGVWRAAMKEANVALALSEGGTSLDMFQKSALLHALKRARALPFFLADASSQRAAAAFVGLAEAYATTMRADDRADLAKALEAVSHCLDRLIVNDDTAAARVWRARMADQD